MLAVVLVSIAAMRVSAEPTNCDPSRCAAAQAIATECPVCAEASNHGTYVSCVAHTVRDLAAEGSVAINCKGKVTRCAAKSICGKPGFVTCHIPTSECDLTTFTCANDPSVTCATDLDCGFKCKIKSSAERCTQRGGTVSTDTSCCAAANCGG
jgi:hypothetical protein